MVNNVFLRVSGSTWSVTAMFYSVTYLAVYLTTCSAITLEGPKSTSTYAIDPIGSSPRPTSPPKFKLNGRGEMVQTLIWATDLTCGYVSGIRSSSLICGGGECAYYLTSGEAWGNVECCSTEPCTGSDSLFLCVNCDYPALTCINSISYYTYDACDEHCEIDSYTLKCTDIRKPFCNIYAYPEVAVTDWRCGATENTAALNVFTTFSGESGRTFYPQIFTSFDPDAVQVTTSTVFVGGLKSSAGPDGSPGPVYSGVESLETITLVTPISLIVVPSEAISTQITGSSTSTLSSTFSPSRRPLTTPELKSLTGPIVGGVIGGISFVALVSACILFRKKMVRHSRNPNKTSNREATELEASHQWNRPVPRELHEEQAPTFAWHKLRNPSFFHPTRYSDTAPDSPTLGKHPTALLPGQPVEIASTSMNEPVLTPARQELAADDYEVSPEQARSSEHTFQDRSTVSPMSAVRSDPSTPSSRNHFSVVTSNQSGMTPISGRMSSHNESGPM